MISRCFFVLAAFCFYSNSLLAQDVFVSFGEGNNVSSTGTADVSDGVGTAFIFVRNGYDIDAFEVEVSNSDTSVIQFTSVELLNPDLFALGADLGMRWDVVDPVEAIPATDTTPATPARTGSPLAESTAGSARFLGIAVNENGINPDFSQIDPDFDDDADAFLLARINYTIVGEGTTDITLSETDRGFFSNDSPDELLAVSLGSGSLTVTASVIPEPSSLGILALAMVGLLARRNRI